MGGGITMAGLEDADADEALVAVREEREEELEAALVGMGATEALLLVELLEEAGAVSFAALLTLAALTLLELEA